MIRPAQQEDLETVIALAAQLWDRHAPEELREEYTDLIQKEDGVLFLFFAGEEAAGFAHCQLRREYVEGASSSPVGYLEGIFVAPPCRGKGHARALLKACEEWALAKGCRQFASDCELANTQSLHFHLNSGFAEVGRIICFVKQLHN